MRLAKCKGRGTRLQHSSSAPRISLSCTLATRTSDCSCCSREKLKRDFERPARALTLTLAIFAWRRPKIVKNAAPGNRGVKALGKKVADRFLAVKPRKRPRVPRLGTARKKRIRLAARFALLVLFVRCIPRRSGTFQRKSPELRARILTAWSHRYYPRQFCL